ncbi:hypothetical protein FOL47_009401 [Perkinsus chesapeaki]|uniref:Uncharacterized protein n=1 Tax=Perkinsus chesapeaki TaxID=330153 RepID=A0A7J6L8I4_PERCH|nr:hypothetical protein FOL47_009401 [Perkinsus chesapeaki]
MLLLFGLVFANALGYEDEEGEQPPFSNALSPPSNILEWDDFCKYKNGPDSYCKYELAPMLCQGGDQPCGEGPVPSIAIEVTTVTLQSVPMTESAPSTSQPYATTTNSMYTTTGSYVDTTTGIYPDTTVGMVPDTTVSVVADPNDVRFACDAFCKSVNDVNSYCKWWFTDPVCKGADQPCGTADLCSVSSVSTPSKSSSDSVTPTVSSADGLHHPECDYMCKSLNDVLSYCKWWMDTPVCQGGDQPCGDVSVCSSQEWPEPKTPTPAPGAHPGPSQECDAYCAGLNGDGSYCKWWKAAAVCKGGDQSCGVGECASTTPSISFRTPAIPAETEGDTHSAPNANCDAFCVAQNPSLAENLSTYCKWWLKVPVCKHGDQPCNPSICDNALSSGNP